MLLSTAWAGYFIYLNFQVRNGGLAGHQPHLSAGQPQECFGGRQKSLSASSAKLVLKNGFKKIKFFETKIPVLRIRDAYPGSWFFTHPGSRVPEPGSKNGNKREGWKKICCHNFSCGIKFYKIANYFSFEVLKKKIWASFQRIVELFTQNIVNKLSKIWVWDPEKTYSGSRIQGSKRHWIRIRNSVKYHQSFLFQQKWNLFLII